MDGSMTMRELDRGLALLEAPGPALEASGRISRRRWMVSTDSGSGEVGYRSYLRGF